MKLDTGERDVWRYEVDQAMVDAYAEVSGDRNPLHIDPKFAATTPYGKPIAHGFMTLAWLSDALTRAFDDGWQLAGELDVKFVAPVFPGDTVEVSVEVTQVTPDGRGACAVACRVGERTVLAGTASTRAGRDDGQA